MPINEQKIILNLKNNLEHKPITASDLPGVNRIGFGVGAGAATLSGNDNQ